MTTVVSADSNDDKSALYEKLGFTKEYIESLESGSENTMNSLSKTGRSNKEIKNAIEMGFTAQEIADFTDVQWDYLKDKSGSLISVEETYYAVTEDGQARETSKEEALRASALAAAPGEGSDEEETAWMKSILTVSWDPWFGKKYYLKYSFEWLTEPFWNLEDAVAITHPEYMTQVQDSEIFVYNWDRHTNDFLQKYVSTQVDVKMSADTKNANGMAFKYDIKSRDGNDVGITYILKKYRGYMVFGVKRASDQYTQGTAYGHYAHSEIAITGSIGVKVSLNSLSVSGAAKVTNMTDTGVTFDFVDENETKN